MTAKKDCRKDCQKRTFISLSVISLLIIMIDKVESWAFFKKLKKTKKKKKLHIYAFLSYLSFFLPHILKIVVLLLSKYSFSRTANKDLKNLVVL